MPADLPGPYDDDVHEEMMAATTATPFLPTAAAPRNPNLSTDIHPHFRKNPWFYCAAPTFSGHTKPLLIVRSDDTIPQSTAR
jgi:hypothetical protein